MIEGIVEQLLLRDLGDERADFGIERGGGGGYAAQIVQQVRAQHVFAARRVGGGAFLGEGVEFGLGVRAGIGKGGVGGETGGQKEGLGGRSARR